MRFSPIALLLAASAAHAQWTVVNLHPTGTLFSYGYGGSGSAQVGYSQATAQGPHAWYWSGAAPGIDLNPAGASYSLAFGSSGNIQGGYMQTDRRRACIWSGSAGSVIDLHPTQGPSSTEVRALDGGIQVGTGSFGGNVHASAWAGSSASWADINPPIASLSEARAVKGNQIVGYLYDPNTTFHACLWTAASASAFIDLHPGTGYSTSDAWGTDGVQQVGLAAYTQGGNHAIVWSGTAASFIDLAPAGSFASEAFAVLDGMQVGDVDNHATVWTGSAASAVDIHPAGYVNSVARAIWKSGGFTYIAGYGRFGSQDRALLWKRADPCYANCDSSTAPPTLNSLDFGCFLSKFAAGDTYANCDSSTAPPTLNALDFSCFLTKFATGCP